MAAAADRFDAYDDDDDDDDDLGCKSFKDVNESDSKIIDKENKRPHNDNEASQFSDGDDEVTFKQQVTSTPFEAAKKMERKRFGRRRRSGGKEKEFPEGGFYGYGRHKDGSEICESGF